MFQCEVCWRMYLSQREADLCTPASEWPERYPNMGRITDQNSVFSLDNDQTI